MQSLRTAHLTCGLMVLACTESAGVSVIPVSPFGPSLLQKLVKQRRELKRRRAEYRAGKMDFLEEVLQTPNLYGWEKM